MHDKSSEYKDKIVTVRGKLTGREMKMLVIDWYNHFTGKEHWWRTSTSDPNWRICFQYNNRCAALGLRDFIDQDDDRVLLVEHNGYLMLIHVLEIDKDSPVIDLPMMAVDVDMFRR